MSEKRKKFYYAASAVGSWLVMDARKPEGQKGIAFCTKKSVAVKILNALNYYACRKDHKQRCEQ